MEGLHWCVLLLLFCTTNGNSTTWTTTESNTHSTTQTSDFASTQLLLSDPTDNNSSQPLLSESSHNDSSSGKPSHNDSQQIPFREPSDTHLLQPPSNAPSHSDSPQSTLRSGAQESLLPTTTTNISTQTGSVVFLPCESPPSMGKQVQVSWVRRNDWHILTSGPNTYTKEERFAVHHKKDDNKWTLAIKYVRQSDAGTYECQIVGGGFSMSQLVHVTVATPRAVIPGNGEYHVDAGSTISLVCFIRQITVAPQYIFWYHNSRMINYDQSRGGINVQIDTEPQILSHLTVTGAKASDSGNYTCTAANTEPASITVYITQVNKIAAIQPRAVDSSSQRATASMLSTFALSLFSTLLFQTAPTVCTLQKLCSLVLGVFTGLLIQPKPALVFLTWVVPLKR